MTPEQENKVCCLVKRSKIIQIIPANGWCYGFRSKTEGACDDYSPLAFWALIEDGEGNHIVGFSELEIGLTDVESDERFVGYGSPLP
jgi:hypothetical protein